MKLKFEIASRHEFPSDDLGEMHKLRAKVFKGRMGWNVSLLSGMEIDGYDAIEPLYMMIRKTGGILMGCWRILPTVGPYMLKDSFPELLHGQPAPSDPKIWELSRFAIETGGQQNFGFSEVAMESIGQIIAYGHETGIQQYLTVTTTAIERLLQRANVATKRFGPPIRIGIENTVALYVDIEVTFNALFGTTLSKTASAEAE
jgi:acyl homoserine lactone synthase